MVGLSAVAMALTAPGQTAGVSVLIDPMIAELDVGRTQISTAYLTGTLLGACAMPALGRAVDRWGPRAVMALVGLCFGGVLLGLSAVSGVVGLTAGFVGIRMAGQGALTLVATTTVAYWFDRRRGLALGLTGALGTAGISFAPVLIGRLVSTTGWREAWAVQGLVVWAVVIPVALLGIRNRPADLGQQVDGAAAPADGALPDEPAGPPPREVLRTGMFWAIAGCLAASSMLVTGLNFHQVGLLGERGLSPVAAAANFLPQTGAALLGGFAAGALLDRVPPKAVLCGAMAVLAGAVLSVRFVEPGWSALAFGFLLGGSGGILRSVESAAFPRYFGTAHLGAIRGSAHTVTVGASAFGPLAVSYGRDLTGAYTPALLALAALPAVAVVLVLLVREPAAPPVGGGVPPGARGPEARAESEGAVHDVQADQAAGRVPEGFGDRRQNPEAQ